MGSHNVASAGATKEFFVPAGCGAYEEYFNVRGLFQVIRMPENYISHTSFKVPHDFNAIVSAEFLLIPTATIADAEFDLFTNYCAEGEDYETHAENDTTTTYNLTARCLFAVDFSNVLTALLTDDYVGLRFTNDEADLIVYGIGVRFRYT